MTLQYQSRCMKTDGKMYCRDLKVLGDEVYSNWWRKQGHRVDEDDLQDILSAEPGIVVIGTGYAGFMEVPNALRKTLRARNIELIAEKTPEAVEVFNVIQSRGKKIAGAFHLTC